MNLGRFSFTTDDIACPVFFYIGSENFVDVEHEWYNRDECIKHAHIFETEELAQSYKTKRENPQSTYLSRDICSKPANILWYKLCEARIDNKIIHTTGASGILVPNRFSEVLRQKIKNNNLVFYAAKRPGCCPSLYPSTDAERYRILESIPPEFQRWITPEHPYRYNRYLVLYSDKPSDGDQYEELTIDDIRDCLDYWYHGILLCNAERENEWFEPADNVRRILDKCLNEQ